MFKVDGAPASLNAGSVALNTSTPTLIVSANAGRNRLKLSYTNQGIYIGGSTVTAGNGYLLPHAGTSQQEREEIETADAVYAIAQSGTPVLNFLELFD